MKSPSVVIVGAGINGLVAANYLQRSGCNVTLLERAPRAGGACVSAEAVIEGQSHHYALGASVLGLMQQFVFEQTGLSDRLKTFVPDTPKLVHFKGQNTPARIFRNPLELDRELADKWGEQGDVRAFREDEASVIRFLQAGYRAARPPTLEAARTELGQDITQLWISGSARNLLDHYFTSDFSRMYMAMTVTESGPVSLDESYSAFTLPLMDSGSIFDGYYGFVAGGIWQVTETLCQINAQLGVDIQLSSPVQEVDSRAGTVRVHQASGVREYAFDHLIFATDPLTAARLSGNERQLAAVEDQALLGSSGKLNLMFNNPVRWKHGTGVPHTDSAFRFAFGVSSLEEYEAATLSVVQDAVAYSPGFLQIYCEGSAMRALGGNEPLDRLAVFFKNLALDLPGEALEAVEAKVKASVLSLIQNPEDCVWSRLLTPRDLQHLFHFPGGNIDHTVLTGGQTYFDRTYSSKPDESFYQFGNNERFWICGAGTYPCGSVAGTPGYMCSQELLRSIDPR